MGGPRLEHPGLEGELVKGDGWEAELLGSADAESLLVVVHGGFWRARVAADSIRPLAVSLAKADSLVWNLEYQRLGMPGGGWPGTAEAVGRALDAALVASAGRPVVAVGHSSGGHLALWAARGRPLRGVVALAPLVDLESAALESLGDGAVEALLGAGPGALPARYAEAAPLRRLPLGVPAVLVHGDADTSVPHLQSRNYRSAAAAAGDEVVLVELSGLNHMQLIEPDGPARVVVDEQIASLLRRGRTM